MSIFDFFGIGKKKEVSAPLQWATALLWTKKPIVAKQTIAPTTWAWAVAPTPKIDFFTPKTKVASVPQLWQPQIPGTTLSQHTPTAMEKTQGAVEQLWKSIQWWFMQNIFWSLKWLTGPIWQKLVEGNKTFDPQNIWTKDIRKYIVTPKAIGDIIGLVPDKYKQVAKERLGEQNIKIWEKETKFYENNPDLLPKYTTWLVTAIKNKDTAQLGDPSYWTDLVWRGFGQMIPALTIAIATKNPELAMISFFPQQVQEAYEDVSADEDINLNESQKQSYALALGAVTSAIENLSFGVVAKPFMKWVQKEVLQEVMKSPLRVWLMQVLESFGAEGTEEVLQKLTTDTMAKIFGSTRNFPKIEELANTFLEAGIWSLGAGGMWWVSEFSSQRWINKEIMAKPLDKSEKFQEKEKYEFNVWWETYIWEAIKKDGNVVGWIAVSEDWEIEWLYIEPKYRKQWIAEEAVNNLLKSGKEYYVRATPSAKKFRDKIWVVWDGWFNEDAWLREWKLEQKKQEKQVTTNILEDILKENKKPEISIKQIENTLNRQQYKEPEKRIIREVLDSVEWENISREDLNFMVKDKLLELWWKPTEKFAEYNSLRDEVWYNVDDSFSRIYTAPFETEAGEVHFRDQEWSEKYYAHARVEDLWATNRVVEIQSDLFQRWRFEKEKTAWKMLKHERQKAESERIIKEEEEKIPNLEKAIEKLQSYIKKWVDIWNKIEKQADLDVQWLKKLAEERWTYVNESQARRDFIFWLSKEYFPGIDKGIIETMLSTWIGEKDNWTQLQVRKLDGILESSRKWLRDNKEKIKTSDEFIKKWGEPEVDQFLEDYKNRWFERIIREEIRNASIEWKEFVQIPDGETIAKIEWYLGESSSLPANLEEWDEIYAPTLGENVIILEVDNDGYRVAPQNSLQWSHNVDEYVDQEVDYIVDNLQNDDAEYEVTEFYHNQAQSFEWLQKFHPDDDLEWLQNYVKENLEDEFREWYTKKEFGYSDTNSRRNRVRDRIEDQWYNTFVVTDNNDIYVFANDSSEYMWAWGIMWADRSEQYENLWEDQKAVVDFYDKRLIPYAKKLKKDSEFVEEDDWRWLQIPITESDKWPVTAFQEEARSSTKEKATQEDIEKAKALLPEASYRTVEQIVNPKTWLPAYWSYLDGMITFAKTLTKTTAYHEVFHAYFDMFTDQKTQREIIEIVKKNQKIDNDLDAEERLAEKFAENAINIEQWKETKGNYKILDFLDELRMKVKSIFSNEAKIKQLYADIMKWKRPVKPSQERALQQKFREKSELDKFLEEMDPIKDEDYTKNWMDYLDKVEPTLKEIEEITAEQTNFNNMTEQELDKFYNSGRYDKLSDFEKQEFDNIMNKRVFVNPLQFADPERQKFIDRIAKLEHKEQRIGKVGKNKISKDKAHKQSIEVDRERESIIEDIQEHYNFESTNDAYDMYAQLRDVPIDEIKYEPRKWSYVSKAEKQRRTMERVDKKRKETPEEKDRRMKNIMGSVMIDARNKGKVRTEVKAMMTMMDVKKGEMPPPLNKENNLADDFYDSNKLTEQERKEVLKGKSSKEVKEWALNRWERYIKPIGTQIENLSPSVYARIKKYDFDVVIKGQKDMEEAMPFLEWVAKLRKDNIDEYFSLRLALSNRDVRKANKIMDKYNILFPKALLEKIYLEWEDAGFDIGHLEDYFPRVVKDSKGLIGALRRSPERSYIEDAIRRIEEMREEKLSIEEEAEIINALFLWKAVDGVMLWSPNMKERSVELVKKDLLQYYYTPEEWLTRYLGSMRDAIEVWKLFGNSWEFDTSLWMFIAQEVADNKVQYEDAEKLRMLLEEKFEKTKTNPFINRVKTVGYTASLGSYSSTITQLWDLSFSFIENGIRKTLKQYGKSISGKSQLTAKEFGLDDIWQEFRWDGIAKKVLSTVLKWSWFSWMDKRGKETYINSTFDELVSKAKKNNQELALELNDYYWQVKAKQIMKDLKEWKATDDVRTYIFLKLCNIQPLTATEMPPGYHKNPVFYMLKSFALKQLDYIVKKWIKYAIKNPKKGIPRLARIMFFIMMMNGISDELKNITLGRKNNSIFYRLLNGDDIGPALSWLFMDNFLKMFGLTKYSIYEAKTNGIDKAFTNIFLSIPPLQVPWNIISDILWMLNWKTSFEDLKSLQMIPWIGKPLYRWAGKWQASQQKSIESERKKWAPTSWWL